ncbi:MAG: cytochrome c [Chloroflexota bacterium]|nr:cytochrome c [Chloroflexota bacterium]
MRLKTLGVIVVTALAIFTVAYWVTDPARLLGQQTQEQKEQLAYGARVFANNATDTSAARCARCHGDDGKGGPVPGAKGVNAPNLHSASLAAKLKINPDYVHLVVSFGGVVVSGNVASLMPAWSTDAGGSLTVQQIDAVVALVTSWAAEAATQSQAPVPNTVEAGKQVFSSAGCVSCHAADLSGGVGPNIQNIGNELVTTGLPTPPSGLAQMKADYAANPKDFLTKWIRDSGQNYNGGTATGMPPFPASQLADDQLQALITFLLSQKK